MDFDRQSWQWEEKKNKICQILAGCIVKESYQSFYIKQTKFLQFIIHLYVYRHGSIIYIEKTLILWKFSILWNTVSDSLRGQNSVGTKLLGSHLLSKSSCQSSKIFQVKNISIYKVGLMSRVRSGQDNTCLGYIVEMKR